ncbi:trypsin-1-like [Zootermopsis nevadensis]|uniref:trypsin-1-like n=1 Tax=Zootermopsis nevadensis TaxID=136037 RepID=UPI000B8E51C4|nr:trypsin-1-like [Zootermopsis nevadensis]
MLKKESSHFKQVSLQYGGSHYCGATVLSPEYVLTAAHCIFGNSIDDYSVRAGTNTYYTGGTVHRVIEWAYHENYVNEAYWNDDIAVVKVRPDIILGDNIKLTTLPPPGDEPKGGAASVAIGWGSGCYGCAGIPNLQKVNLKIYSHEDCLDIYGFGPTTDMVCSGIPEEEKGVCSGDSGGALLVDGIQVGITSWTRVPCAEYPAVWTKVSHYRDWIAEKTGV